MYDPSKESYTSDTCPVCGEFANSACRCAGGFGTTNTRRCKNNHMWYWKKYENGDGWFKMVGDSHGANVIDAEKEFLTKAEAELTAAEDERLIDAIAHEVNPTLALYKEYVAQLEEKPSQDYIRVGPYLLPVKFDRENKHQRQMIDAYNTFNSSCRKNANS